MFHVLIFQQGKKYILDTAGSSRERETEGGEVQFGCLDELVLFLTGHTLKVGDEELQLTDTCPCENNSIRLSSNGECYSSLNLQSITYINIIQYVCSYRAEL